MEILKLLMIEHIIVNMKNIKNEKFYICILKMNCIVCKKPLNIFGKCSTRKSCVIEYNNKSLKTLKELESFFAV